MSSYRWGLDEHKFVRDWRVAGALMEKMLPDAHFPLYSVIAEAVTKMILGKADSLPRAVCEACVEARVNSLFSGDRR
jgi:hypothetical protein